ncbi:MAG: recombinase family protein [Albidovulum sp.]|nr:recombinase family protein [Albidovulum sp.]
MAENPSRTTIEYLRISREEQDLAKNLFDILALANREDLRRIEFVEEKASGRIGWRKREIADILDELRVGDALFAGEFSRLGRSILECMEILAIASDASIRVNLIKGS